MARQYVRCPRRGCGATSKKLSTLMGVEERECRNGHRFEHDKWMADRLWGNPQFIGRVTR
jgi:hypothetical protein